MIPFWVAAIGLGGILGGVAYYVYKHWDEVLNWLYEFLPKVSSALRNLAKVFEGKAKYYAEAAADLVDAVHVTIKHILYVKEGNQWTETVTSRKVERNALPSKYKSRLRNVGDEIDITDELESELGMELC